MNPFQVIFKPILSEKSNATREKLNKYTFVVDKHASKLDIKKAVSALWGAEVEKVTTLLQRGKKKRRGAHYSQPVLTKKATVTLVGDSKLPIFEDQ